MPVSVEKPPASRPDKSPYTEWLEGLGCLKLDLTDLLELSGLGPGVRHVSHQRQCLLVVCPSGREYLGTVGGGAKLLLGSMKRTKKRRCSGWDD